MSVRPGLLSSELTNAALGWTLVACLALFAVERALSGDPIRGGMAAVVVGVALVPPVVSGRPTAMLAWEVLGLAALPVVVPSLGVLVGPLDYAALATLALVVAVELDAFTAVEMTPAFAVAFVVIVTMAVAGLWTVVRFAADVYLGTSLIAGENAAMWDLVAATGVGLLAGLAFELYVRRHSPGHRLAHDRRRETP